MERRARESREGKRKEKVLLVDALKPAIDATDQWRNQLNTATSLDISPDSVATHLRYGGIFSNIIITNFMLILTVK